MKNAAFPQQKCRIYFVLTQSKTDPVPKFWSDLHSGSNPISTNLLLPRSSPTHVQSNAYLWCRLWFH